MNPLFTRIDTVFLEVTDLEQSVQWYAETFGFPVRWMHPEGGYACLDVGETPLTLVRADSATPGNHMRFNFFTPDAHAAHRRLAEKGASPTDLQNDGGLHWFEFTDPDGHKLGICHFGE